MMMKEIIVIFGGTKGIGRAIAEKFFVSGYSVSVLSRSEHNIETTLKHLTKQHETSSNLTVSGHVCDVTNEKDVSCCMNHIEQNEGCISTLIHAAGINVNQLLLKTSAKQIESVVQTNLIGAMITNKAAVQCMIKRKAAGNIINIGSVIGMTGNAGQCAYAASKAGLVGFTKSLAKEAASRGIRANVVAPGFTNTSMLEGLNLEAVTKQVPLRRIAAPEEVAEAVYFLNRSSYITGEVLLIDGGLHLNA